VLSHELSLSLSLHKQGSRGDAHCAPALCRSLFTTLHTRSIRRHAQISNIRSSRSKKDLRMSVLSVSSRTQTVPLSLIARASQLLTNISFAGKFCAISKMAPVQLMECVILRSANFQSIIRVQFELKTCTWCQIT
jgi:hypothetical protein